MGKRNNKEVIEMSETLDKVNSHVGTNLDAYMAKYQELSEKLKGLNDKVMEAQAVIKAASEEALPLKENLIALSAAIQALQGVKNLSLPAANADDVKIVS